MKKLTSRAKRSRKRLNGKPLKAPAGTMPWNPDLNAYAAVKALTFSSGDEIDAAIDLLWSDALCKMPHELAGGDTIIVPAEAVEYFKDAKLAFSENDVLCPADLPAEELNTLRREQGPY